ncbi:MAG TPA: isoprenylcysteine carboxylmethyltransferase family protein [Vicinamibacterales bacterium]
MAGWLLERFMPLHLPLGVARWPIAAILLLGWIALWAAALPRFRAAHTPVSPREPVTALMTSGIYGRMRNPLYLGLSLFYLGITAIAQSGWMLLLFVLVTAIVQYAVIGAEERYLERRFGTQYVEYKQRVRRWF